MQEHKPIMSDVSVETLNARRHLMSSWSSAQKKKFLRRLQKHEEDLMKLITSENLYEICHGDQNGEGNESEEEVNRN